MVQDFSTQFSLFYLLRMDGAEIWCHPVYYVINIILDFINKTLFFGLSNYLHKFGFFTF